LKAPQWHQREGQNIARAVVTVLKDRGYAERSDRVFLQCFDDATLRYLRDTLNSPLPLIQLIADSQWGEDSEVDFDYLLTDKGLDEIARYADGIGPWLMQIYRGRDAAGKPQFTDLVSRAHARGLKVHPYSFRADDLPEGIANFTELLALFIDEHQIDGLFTDFPDLVREFLSRR
jgi:glycerophosphoryl diester phosphodiesterase